MTYSSVYTSRSSRTHINTSEGEYLTTDSGIVFLHTNVAKKHSASGKVHAWTEAYVHAKTTGAKYRYKRLLSVPGYYEHTLELAKNSGSLRQKCKDVIFRICEKTDINFNQIMEDLDVEEISNLIMSTNINTHIDENMSVISGVTDDYTMGDDSLSTDSDSTWEPHGRKVVSIQASVTCSETDSISVVTLDSKNSDSTWEPMQDVRMMAQDAYGYENISMITTSDYDEDEDSSSDYELDVGLGF